MTDFKWGAPTSESSNIAGAAMDSKGDGATTFIADIDLTSSRSLNLRLWMVLGSITTAAGASAKLELREKRGSTYAMNAVAESTAEVKTTGTGQKDISFRLQAPGGFVYGLYWTNNLGTTSAGSGNALYVQEFNEADS